MGKKILVIISLFVLFMFVDVKAVTCEYPEDKNGISITLVSDNIGWNVFPSGGYSFADVNISTSKNTCPSNLYYRCHTSLKNCSVSDKNNASSSLTDKFYKIGSLRLKKGSIGNNGGGNSGGGINLGGNTDCRSIYGDLLDFLEKNVFKIIYFLTPIVLIVLTSIDFAKAVFNDEKDGMKKATSNFVKRAVAAILIFLAPTFVEIILSLLNNASISDCMI